MQTLYPKHQEVAVMTRKIDDACLICDQTVDYVERLIRLRWSDHREYSHRMAVSTGTASDADWYLCSECIAAIKELTI